jgi:hypothetical protein
VLVVLVATAALVLVAIPLIVVVRTYGSRQDESEAQY